MKATRARVVIRRIVEALAAGLILYVVISGWRVERWVLGGGGGERGLYIKLPLEGPRYHWYFGDEAALLKGSLRIDIRGASGRDTTLSVFDQGRMSPGWSFIGRRRDGAYFGFMGGGEIWTEPKDSVVVTLDVPEDLEGMGAYRQGVLRSGHYRAVASYGRLTGHPDFGLLGGRREPTAYVSCWRSKWPLVITEQRGWMGRASDEEQGRGGWLGKLDEVISARRGTDGFRCVK